MILNFEDIILTPQRCVVESRKDCDTTAKLGNNTFAVPVCAANMKSILTPEICKTFDKRGWFYVYHRIDGVEDVKNFIEYANDTAGFDVVSISVGVKYEWRKFVVECKKAGYHIDYFTVDIAHADSDNILPILETIKNCYPDSYVICGNGCTKNWVRWIESLGLVDCLKVGIGVSESCRTREYTGFGSSTLGSLLECKQAVNDVKLMSDGGITVRGDTIAIGDITKALVFGADWVMSGVLFSKCIDSPSVIHGYYGNASREAKGNDHVEGELIKVISNGLTIEEMMKLIEESLRSSISYAGQTKIQNLVGTPYQVRD